MERNQKSLWDKVKSLDLNLWRRDRKIAKTINDHRRNGCTPPHTEAKRDVDNLQLTWKWLESLEDGGLKVRIGKRAFYVKFDQNGNTERLTLWSNYFPESE